MNLPLHTRIDTLALMCMVVFHRLVVSTNAEIPVVHAESKLRLCCHVGIVSALLVTFEERITSARRDVPISCHAAISARSVASCPRVQM